MNWKFKLAQDYSWDSNNQYKNDIDFYDVNKKKIRLRIEKNGKITVFTGYAWDGCSPKFNILDLFLFGTPDGIFNPIIGKPKTYYASLIHDALYQFMDDPRMPVKRNQMDKFFLLIMKRDNFLLRHIYYIAVRGLGWLYNFFANLFHKIFGG